MWSWWLNWLKYVRGLRIGHPKHYTTFPATGTYDYTGQSATLTYTPAIDNTPNQFTFTDQTGVALSTVITSAAVTISGLGSGVSITLNASGGTIDKNSDGNFLGSQIVTNGDTVRARVTSSASNSTAVNCVVAASPSGVADTFTATTLATTSYAGLTPDFYISTTGSNSNSGTSSSPWAISALAYGSSKYNTIRGKVIGIKNGTYICNGLAGSSWRQTPNLIVPVGFSGQPTTVVAETARGVTLTNQSGGTRDDRPVIGQGGDGQEGGYATILNLTIIGGSYCGIAFGSGGGGGVYPQVTISGCDVSDLVRSNGDNNACVWLQCLDAPLVTECKLHDVSGSNAGHNYTGVILFGCHNAVIEKNEIYNAYAAVYDKHEHVTVEIYGTIARYNYIYNTRQPFVGFDNGVLSATSVHYVINNNLVLLPTNAVWIFNPDIHDGLHIQSPVDFYNNTMVGSDLTTGGVGLFHPTLPNASFYNNILKTTGTVNIGITHLDVGSSGVATADYNCYRLTNPNFKVDNSTVYSTFLSYQARAGGAFEQHSITSDPLFVGGTGVSAYKLDTLSPCKATGSGGVNMGCFSSAGQTEQIGVSW